MHESLFQSSTLNNTIYSIVAVIIIYFVGYCVRRLINTNIQDLKRRHSMRKVSFYVAVFILALILFEIWTASLPSLTTIISFIGAGLALALHEVVLCFAGWVLINIKKPYEVGERIEANTIKGDVIDIGVFHTIMIEVGNWVEAEQSTGRIISIPNSTIFRQAVFNYSKEFEFVWNEIPILITFESNYNKARECILSIAQENAEDVQSKMSSLLEKMSHRYMVHYSKLTPTVYTKIADCGVLLTLRYLTAPQKRRISEDLISRKILDVFLEESDIDFAYPTTRFYHMPEEGKHDVSQKPI